MADLKATPVINNKALALSKLLRGGRDFANKAQIPDWLPLIGGQGVGDMLVGKAPEEVENWAYGNYPFHVPEMSNIPVMKTGRTQGVFDAASMVPVGAGGAGQAMITAGGDPRLLLSRGTVKDALLYALKNKNKIDNPSFAIAKEYLPENFGDVFVLPHPRALDPKYHPRNSELYNIDAYTGPRSSITGETRLQWGDLPDTEEYALRVAMSPKYNSFKHFENSSHGAKLGVLDQNVGNGTGATWSGSFQAVIDELQKFDPDWVENLANDPKMYAKVLDDPNINRRHVDRIRKSSGVGQEHAELKYAGGFPISEDTIQAVLVPPSFKYPDNFMGWPDPFKYPRIVKALRERNIPLIEYKNTPEAVEITTDLQKKAKF